MIVVDHTQTPTADRADLLLPAATFVESDGTLVNNEGRAQRFYKVLPPTGDVQESWRWLSDLMTSANPDRADQQRWQRFDDVVSALAAAMPVFAPVAMVAPSADFRIAGQKVARQAARFSGRTAMFADIDVSEPQPPADIDSPLTFSMEGYQKQPPSSLIPRFWAPGWNSVQALNKFQEEVGGPCAAATRDSVSSSRNRRAAVLSRTSIRFRPPSSRLPDAGCWCLCSTSSARRN